jgi:hypothetical protein
MRYIETVLTRGIVYDMADEVRDLFEVISLQQLHTISPEKYEKLFEAGKDDSSTFFHNTFYDKLRAGWPAMTGAYEELINSVIALIHFEENFLYQKFPTFRVHLPGNLAVGKFHKDSEFGHPPGEVNYMIPLTNASHSATTWCESAPDKGDFESMPMKYGSLITFDGNQLTHGNHVNNEGYTRVSMDFRVLPISKYNPDSGASSLTRNTKFVEGQYYTRYTHK